MIKKADKIFRSGDSVYLRVAYGSTLLSAQSGQIKFSSAFEEDNSELHDAISKLSELDNSSQLRLDAISNGKAVIANWKPPTGEEIDVIIANMKKRLLA